MLQLGLFLLVLSPLFSQSNAAPLAMLVSGGGNPAKNACAFYDAINQAQEVFSGWDKVVAMTDGQKTGAPNAVLCNPKGKVILDEHRRPELGRVLPNPHAESELIAATFESLKANLKKKAKQLKPGEPVLFFLDDHGMEGPPRSKLTLWWERITSDQMRDLVSIVPPENKVMMISNFCYGGEFIAALKDKKGNPRKNACGFFTSAANETVSYTEHWLSYPRLEKNMDFREVFDSMSRGIKASTPFSSETDFLNLYLKKIRKTKKLVDCADCIPNSKTAIREMESLGYSSPAMKALNEEMKAIEARALVFQAELSQFPIENGIPSAATLEAELKAREKALKPLVKNQRRLDDLFSIARGGFIFKKMGKEAYEKYYSLEYDAEKADKNIRKMSRDLRALKKKQTQLKKRKFPKEISSPLSQHILGNNVLVEDFKRWEREVVETDVKIKKKTAAIKRTKLKLKRLREEVKPYDIEYERWNKAAVLDNPEFVKFAEENYQDKKMQSLYSDEDKWEDPDEKWTPEKLVQFSKVDIEYRKELAKVRPLRQLLRDVKSLEALREMTERRDEKAASDFLNIVECGKVPLQLKSREARK